MASHSGAVTAPATVTVAGAGALRDLIAPLLVRLLTPPEDLVVTVSDDARLAWHAQAPDADDDRTHLPVRHEAGRVIVGPAWRRGTIGCPMCVQVRRNAPRADAAWIAHPPEPPRPHHHDPPLLTSAAGAVAAALVVRLVVESGGVAGTWRSFGVRTYVALTLLTLDIAEHRMLPVARCAQCGDLPADAPGRVRLGDHPLPKVSPTTLRVRDLRHERERLTSVYVDADAGVARELRRVGAAISPTTAAPFGNRAGDAGIGYGRGLDYPSSAVTALAEALERYGGIACRGVTSLLRGSYRSLRDRAADPSTFGLHARRRYDEHDFPYQRYHPDLTVTWVWGHRAVSGTPVLVPHDLVYYGHVYGARDEAPFVYEISNGCALGGCLEEAVLHGLFEVIERDAFLLTWYAMLGVPRLDLHSTNDPVVPLLVERIQRLTGYNVQAYAMTLDIDVPAVWAMAVDEHDRDGQAKALCAASAHLYPEAALRNALLELESMVRFRPAEYRQQREQVHQMVSDADLVKGHDSHALLYCDPAAFHRLEFLWRGGRARPMPVREAFASAYARPHHADLRDDLDAALAHVTRAGLDVIVVDQTTPEHRVADLRCAKVLIPGALPMTFGHRARRLDGLHRIRTVPAALGYRTAPLRDDDINPHPHPFP